MIILHNGEGGLEPLMLSRLIEEAQKVLDTIGDIPVAVGTTETGYDDTYYTKQAVCSIPDVIKSDNIRSAKRWYFARNFPNVFYIDGEL